MLNKTNSIYLTIKLNPTELSILDHLSNGLTSFAIGEKVFLSRRTVEGIRQLLLIKTDSVNSAMLVAFAFRNGIIV